MAKNNHNQSNATENVDKAGSEATPATDQKQSLGKGMTAILAENTTTPSEQYQDLINENDALQDTITTLNKKITDLEAIIAAQVETVQRLNESEASLISEACHLKTDGYAPDGYVLISTDQLDQLSEFIGELKTDIGALVNVFQNFSGLFTGDVGPIKIAAIVGKLLTDKTRMAQISNITSVIEKYTQSPENNA